MSEYNHQNIYSPENNTSQNIEIYNKLNKNQNNINNQNQSSNNLIETYNLPSYENNTGNLTYPIADYLQSPNNLPINNYYNNINNENLNNKNNTINNQIKIDKSDSKIDIKREKEKEKEKENKEIIEDPDEILFKNNDKKKEDEKNEDKESLSSYSDKNSFDEKDYNDVLYSQYKNDKIKRIKNKWKVHLHGCILDKDNKEIVLGNVNGDLERDW